VDTVRTFPHDTRSPGCARRWLGGHLQRWVPDGDHDGSLLLLSELVTNAVVHARTACTVAVRFRNGCLTVRVLDHCPTAPVVASDRHLGDGGRGLQLVDTLATSFGWDPVGDDSKIVWFEIPVTA
jgi:anti-sigma regulatory factor (Ser/Thr protein kinase)